MHLRDAVKFAGLTLAILTPVQAVDLEIVPEPYGIAGLFTNPIIPAEGDTVTITVRAVVRGEVSRRLTADLSVVDPEGEPERHKVELTAEEGPALVGVEMTTVKNGSFRVVPKADPKRRTAAGRIRWEAPRNGRYTVTAKLDPDNIIRETDETNNTASLELPVVTPGRQPHFVWYHHHEYLRWPTVWAGSPPKESYTRWQERGVKPLRWHGGFTQMRGEITEERVIRAFETRMAKRPGASGLAVDEIGHYPTPESRERFRAYMAATRKAHKKHPGEYLALWHCGGCYPEQVAQYRGACDLVLLESYVFNWGPKGLATENVYDFLDMKMRPARQCDLLVPTGKGTQAITTIDLTYPTFNRGKLEAIVRHLRRHWPEMRGIGSFGTCTREAPKGDLDAMNRGIANNKFIDQLWYRYFVPPVVTLLPGNLWVHREDDGTHRITAAVSNIGGMDSGLVKVAIFADGKRLTAEAVERVPAGNNLKENQALVAARWTPRPGPYRVQARIEEARACTVLDCEASESYFVSPPSTERNGQAR